MNAEIATLERELVYFQTKAQECSDVIKQLAGYTPENFSVTFSVSKQPILSFEIGAQELNFSIGLFMSWHSFYTQRIKEHQKVLEALKAERYAGNPNELKTINIDMPISEFLGD